MELNPRYGTDPVITLDGRPSDAVGPLLRQRRRLAVALGTFRAEQWAHPSRCAGWSNLDVMVHLESTNSFWAFSIESGLRGEPTRFLNGFDPVASPAQLVAASDADPDQVLDRFAASTESLGSLLSSLADDDWSRLAESPPGHLPIGAVAQHALWDGWVHERDVLLPLGIAPEEDPDEVAGSLRYVAALGPALAMNQGSTERGVLAVAATTPDLRFVVEVGDRVAVREGTEPADLELRGDAVALLESLSLRAPLRQPVPEGARWLLSGLAVAFDAEPA